MSSHTAAYRCPFRLSPASPLQSSLLNLPLELRYRVYAEIFQPRTYLYEKGGMGFVGVRHEECRHVIHKPCQRTQPCFLWHHICGCSLVEAVSLLRTCQQIYVEAQPQFLLSATLKLHAVRYYNGVSLGQDKADQVRSFHRHFLLSSLSGLVPADCLRRLDLRFAGTTNHAVFDNLKAIDDCRLRLDCLQLQLFNRWLPSYRDPELISSDFFKAMSLLRDIKNVQLTWSLMNYNPVHASDEPEIYTQYIRDKCGPPGYSPEFAAYLESVQDRYCGLLNRAFSELTSRPRTTKGRKRFATLHKEAKAIFLFRMQELVEESCLYLEHDSKGL